MILITEFMDEPAIQRHLGSFEVIYDPGLVDRADELAAKIREAKALIVRNRTQVTNELLSGAPNLKCVGRLGVGLDNIDLDACKSAGIEVYPALGANDLSVAEYVITTAMMLRRKAYFMRDQMISGTWPRQESSGDEIAGSTIGLVGMGSIAQLTAQLARNMGMNILGFDPYLATDHPVRKQVDMVELDDLLSQSDVMSLHIPLTDETRNFISQAQFVQMKNSSYLINAARGGVVDEIALIDALESGQISGAALDVFEREPLDEQAAAKFASVPNLILTPHIAGVTKQSNKRVSDLIACKVAEHLG